MRENHFRWGVRNMKFFCETELSNKVHYFISEQEPRSEKIKAFALDSNQNIVEELEKNISIFNSMSTIHNMLYIFMLLSEVCTKDKDKAYFNKKASDLAHYHVIPTC